MPMVIPACPRMLCSPSYGGPSRTVSPTDNRPRNAWIRDALRPNHLWTGSHWPIWCYTSPARPGLLSRPDMWEAGGVLVTPHDGLLSVAHARRTRDGGDDVIVVTVAAGLWAFGLRLGSAVAEAASGERAALCAMLDEYTAADLLPGDLGRVGAMSLRFA